MDIEQSPTYVALPEYATPARLVAPATDEIFEDKDDCYQRLQGWSLFEGYGVVQGRFWKDRALRWEFKYKLHCTKTLSTRGLEPKS
jgi:hypothetical protein